MPFTHSLSTHYLPALPPFRLFAKSSPRELPRLPFWPRPDSLTAPGPAAEGCQAGLRSGHLSLLSPARWPPGRGYGPVPAGGARPHAPPSPAAPCQGMSHVRPPRASAYLCPLSVTAACCASVELGPPRGGRVLGRPNNTGCCGDVASDLPTGALAGEQTSVSGGLWGPELRSLARSEAVSGDRRGGPEPGADPTFSPADP